MSVVPLRPPPHVVTLKHIELTARLAVLSERYRGKSPRDVLSAVIGEEFSGRAAIISSFGSESAVLLHLAAQVDRNVPVIFLDTLKHFPETLAYREMLVDRLKLTNVIAATPDPAGLHADDPHGNLSAHHPDRCCHVRKTLPMIRALKRYDCLVSGRKRFQAETRRALPLFEAQDRWIKVNPLAGLSRSDIEEYFTRNALPRHPLRSQGYLSIGCAPCTSAVGEGADQRSGRWAGSAKVECGIHLSLDGKLTRAGT